MNSQDVLGILHDLAECEVGYDQERVECESEVDRLLTELGKQHWLLGELNTLEACSRGMKDAALALLIAEGDVRVALEVMYAAKPYRVVWLAEQLALMGGRYDPDAEGYERHCFQKLSNWLQKQLTERFKEAYEEAVQHPAEVANPSPPAPKVRTYSLALTLYHLGACEDWVALATTHKTFDALVALFNQDGYRNAERRKDVRTFLVHCEERGELSFGNYRENIDDAGRCTCFSCQRGGGFFPPEELADIKQALIDYADKHGLYTEE